MIDQARWTGRRRPAGILATTAALAAAIALAGCAGPEATLRYRMPQDPPSLDPHRTNDESSLVYIVNLFDSLVEFEPGGLAYVPAVAESWTVSPDGRTYTFRLRQGVRFHNGREVGAGDVVYSLERALDPLNPSPLRSMLELIRGAGEFAEGRAERLEGAAAPDERTVTITLDHPFGPFLSALATHVGSIVPREVYSDPNEGYLEHPVGSGPFRMESWQRGVSLTLAGFEEHWKGAPGVPRITFRFIANAMTALEEYKTGGLDICNEIPSGQREWVRENLSSEYVQWPRLATAFLGFNHRKAPFMGNRALRRALNLAVDRERIASVIQEGKDEPTSRIVPPGMPGHNPEPGPYRYDPQEAARLLAEAGYPEGKGLPEITYLTASNEAIRRYAQAVQADFARIGVRVKLRTLEFAAYLEAIKGSDESGPDADLFQLIYFADYPDPDGLLRPLLHTSSFGLGGNFGRFSSPEVDRLLDEGRRETDNDRRAALYREAEEIALEEAALIPLYHYGDDALVKPEVQGFRPSPLGDFAAPLELLKMGP